MRRIWEEWAVGPRRFLPPPGRYVVTVTTPEGYDPKTVDAGERGIDSSTTAVMSLTLVDGEYDDTLDFGFRKIAVTSETGAGADGAATGPFGLPFTGADIAVLLSAGSALIVIGWVLTRRRRMV